MDVESWIQKTCQEEPGTPMRELWARMLRHSWKQGREEARGVLESIPLEVAHAFAAGKAVGGALPELDVAQRRMLESIHATCQDRGVDFLGAFSAASSSDFALSQVQANPTKQSPYEAAAVAFLAARSTGRSRVKAVHKLDRAKVVLRFKPDGTVLSGQGTGVGASKSADVAVLLEEEGAERWVLLTHKYARTDGGHQKNQYNDALTFARNALASDRTKAVAELDALHGGGSRPWAVGVLFDGEYFEGKVANARLALGTACWVGSSDDFVAEFGQARAPQGVQLELA